MPEFFFDVSTPSPKNRVSTSVLSPILSVKSAISLQLSSTHILEATRSLILLSLSFNRYIFYKFFDIFIHINDYIVGLQRVELYYNVVEQTAVIFDIRSVFAACLIKAVKKNKSWAMVDWNPRDIA